MTLVQHVCLGTVLPWTVQSQMSASREYTQGPQHFQLIVLNVRCCAPQERPQLWDFWEFIVTAPLLARTFGVCGVHCRIPFKLMNFSNASVALESLDVTFGVISICFLLTGFSASVLVLLSLWDSVWTNQRIFGRGFFVSQTMAEFLFCLLALPFHAYTGMSPTTNAFLNSSHAIICAIAGYLTIVLFTVAAYSHAAMGVYYVLEATIGRRLPWKDLVLRIVKIVLLVLAWVFPFLTYAICFLTRRQDFGYQDSAFGRCTHFQSAPEIYTLDILHWILSLFLVAVSYSIIYLSWVRRASAVTAPEMGETRQRSAGDGQSSVRLIPSAAAPATTAERLLSMKMGCVLAGSFFCCYFFGGLHLVLPFYGSDGGYAVQSLVILQWAGKNVCPPKIKGVQPFIWFL